MRRAVLSDREIVVDILSNSFDGNKSVNHVVKQDSSRTSRIRGLMRYSFEVCLLFGEVWLSPNRKACALLLYPDKKNTTMRSIFLDLQLALDVIGLSRVRKVLTRESAIKANHPNDKHFLYLWFVGVEPSSQKSGIGSALLEDVIARSVQEKRPIYLETSVSRNLSWYKKFGFEMYKEIDLGYTLYLLRRPPVPLRQIVPAQIAAQSI
ncbi:MAG TPA: GNAT family N-acetyltransferase [Ohtaekwangia sp.]|nr:GNAT family N-acetyltransferase [Ohtaekwangia sp.]